MSKHRTVALIPARGGSKGIPKKNVQLIDGIPMVAYTILAASAAEGVDDVYVSSDSLEILKIAQRFGAIPVRRPDEFATDGATTESVVSHFLSEQRSISSIVLTQPTSPMLIAEDIETGLGLYASDDYDTIFSGYKTNDTLIWSSDMEPLNYAPTNRGRRQLRKQHVMVENGAFWIFSRKDFLANECRLYGRIGMSPMPYWRSFQIDSKHDLKNIRILMTAKGT